MRQVEVVLLTKPDCTFCDQAKAILERLSSEFPLTVRTVLLDSAEGEELAVRNGLVFPPGILLNNQPFSHGRPSEGKLRRQLQGLNDPGCGVQASNTPASASPQADRRT